MAINFPNDIYITNFASNQRKARVTSDLLDAKVKAACFGLDLRQVHSIRIQFEK